MSTEGFDTAQICLNGHASNPSFDLLPQFNKAYCKRCGERTITQCEACNGKIQGRYRSSLVLRFDVPGFCHQCGKPYPWTEKSLSSATEYADLIENLSDEDRRQLKLDIGDLVKESPR